MSNKGTNEKLVYLVLVMMIVGIAISIFTLWYSVRNRNAFEREFRQSLIAELDKYNFPQDKEVTIDEAKLYLAVAKYCETRNECTGVNGANGHNGSDGDDGTTGPRGPAGMDGADGQDGYTPVKGVDYFDGHDGEDGEPARNVERQCNSERNRMEWRLEGDTNWQVEFYLAEGQTCEIQSGE